jgi:hypothetical protein
LDDRPPVTADMVAAGLRAFFRIMAAWGVDNREAMVLLGRPARATFFRWKKGEVAGAPFDTVQRISYVVGIYKALQVLYSDAAMADAWMRRANEAFGGQSALDRMTGGDVTDLAAVRDYLDAVCAGAG